MARDITVIPIGTHVGLTIVNLGLIRSITCKDLTVRFLKPVFKFRDDKKKIDNVGHSIFINKLVRCVEIIELSYTKLSYNDNFIMSIVDTIIDKFYQCKKIYDITLIEGFRYTEIGALSYILNYKISLILSTDILFVAADNENIENYFMESNYFFRNIFKSNKQVNILGVILNKCNNFKFNNNSIIDCMDLFGMHFNIFKNNLFSQLEKKYTVFFNNIKLSILATIPFNLELINITVFQCIQYLNAKIIKNNSIECKSIEQIIFFDQLSCINIHNKKYKRMCIISFEQLKYVDNLYLNNIKNSNVIAILLTGVDNFLDKDNKFVSKLLILSNIYIFSVSTNILTTLIKLCNMYYYTYRYDRNIIKQLKDYVSNYISINWCKLLKNINKLTGYISPIFFRYHLIKLANKCKKCIVLPEGNDIRIIKAASICEKKGIAKCILLGNPDEIHEISVREKISGIDSINIINPIEIQNNYIMRLVQLRSKNGMTLFNAKNVIKDNIVLSTLMLENDDVDGVVSGVINTTANTIRPALQLIKLKNNVSLVSSLFFMLLSNKIFIYADCAINIDPNAYELADIAIQSANSAKLFGIHAKIAMISYSTYDSAGGCSVEKVREATYIVKKLRPDLDIDGPLQYDAATVPEIAKLKSPNSPISGDANILIFPDLNTGNTVYKAVQRSANFSAIGPILQGLNKPVNDLSRGANIEDIVYTIAVTAIQSGQ
ncbi:phosphate acetyltransferase [Buchnera aphidicola (Formosaphis micheliae)]|uniref:phosphate acetyltransferase n=1 Tax=Buchnera aphidicola TaxID=9 RepID=UPI0031CC6BC7